MKEHFKRHLSQFCKCGEKMSMNSQGWHCPNDKKRPTQYINYSYKKGFKDGSKATLKEVEELCYGYMCAVCCKFHENNCSDKRCIDLKALIGKLEAKIKEVEK